MGVASLFSKTRVKLNANWIPTLPVKEKKKKKKKKKKRKNKRKIIIWQITDIDSFGHIYLNWYK